MLKETTHRPGRVSNPGLPIRSPTLLPLGQCALPLVKVVFLCWSFLEVYIFATTYWKAFIVRPKEPYPTLLYPTLPFFTLPQPPSCPALPTLSYPTHPCPDHPIPLPNPTSSLPLPSSPTGSYPTLPPRYPLRIQTHAHNQASRSRATVSCDNSYFLW